MHNICLCPLTAFTLALITYKDLKSIDDFKDKTVLAIKAPPQTRLEVPDPQENYQIYLRSKAGPIEVYVCGDEEQQQQQQQQPQQQQENTTAPPVQPPPPPPSLQCVNQVKNEPVDERDLSRELNLNYSWSSALSDEPSDIDNSLSLGDHADGFIDHSNPHSMGVDPSLLPYLTNNGEDDFISLSPLPEYPDLCDGLQHGEGIAELYDVVSPFPVKTWS
ncbi:transcription factor E2F2-like [Dysidea avara]|uniref:transcription factor E2F2-like n=1 Tax=Dysidea avara TaxID=196820 RepID=UPI00331E8C9C